MLELRLQASILKKIVVFIHNMNNGRHNHCSATELVDILKRTTEYFDCIPTEIFLQALDPSNKSLVYLRLRPDAFKHYRCDPPISLEIVPKNMADILDFAANENGRCQSDTSFYYAMKFRGVYCIWN
ncbi:hypothetical protein ACLB2K_076304 [Fragaria x ananassa]